MQLAGCSENSLAGCSRAASSSSEVPRSCFEVPRAKSPFKSRFAHTSEPLKSLELRAVGPRIDSASKYRILTHVSNLGL